MRSSGSSRQLARRVGGDLYDQSSRRSSQPPPLGKATNLIESPQSGVRKKTGNVCRWRDGEMTLRWVAGAFLLTEKNFRKIMGYHDLWALASILGRSPNAASSHKEKVA